MMICNNCRQQVQDGLQQCPFCGAPLNMQQPVFQQNPMQNPQQFVQNMNMQQQKPKKKKKGCLIAVLIFLGLGFLSSLAKGGKNDSGTTQKPAVTSEPAITTAAPETEPTNIEEESTAPAESSEEDVQPIRIVSGEENEYSEEYTLNAGTDSEETNIVYFLPAGRYKVTNIGKYINQINVYSRETYTDDAGWENPVSSPVAERLDPEASAEIEIPEDHYIEIHGGAFELLPIE